MYSHVYSSIVPQATVSHYLSHWKTSALPHIKTAEGLICVYLLSRRSVGYIEFLTVSVWKSKRACGRFCELHTEIHSDEVLSSFGEVLLKEQMFEVIGGGTQSPKVVTKACVPSPAGS